MFIKYQTRVQTIFNYRPEKAQFDEEEEKLGTPITGGRIFYSYQAIRYVMPLVLR